MAQDACAAPHDPATSPPLTDNGDAAPLAFIVKVQGALRLAAVDRVAAALGLVPGLTLADARARHPALRVADMDAGADAHWLARLAQRCVRWSPLVALHPPDGITIDLTGAAHLFGGEAALVDDVADSMAGWGMTLRHACAATAEGAQALARFGARCDTRRGRDSVPGDEAAALRALPVAALGLDADATLALERAGLKRIADVAGRPSAVIAARFGMAAVAALDRLLGQAARPMVPVTLAAPLRFERRFAEPVAHQAALGQAFLALMQDAAASLAERALGGRHFTLTLHRSDGAAQRLEIRTGAPSRDPARLLRLFDERIGTLADPLDPGFGYDSLVLDIGATDPLGAVQDALDPALVSGAGADGSGAAAVAELVDRLATRLGPGAVRRLVPRDSHIPEQAQLALPAVECPAPRPWPAPPADEPPPRPLFLFDPPQRVTVIAEVPDGPPHRFRWRRTLHEVRLYEGPERIGSEWWRREGGEHGGPQPGQPTDDAALTRDYYRVEDARGRRFWIFRHGLYDEKPDPRWYVHGLFA